MSDCIYEMATADKSHSRTVCRTQTALLDSGLRNKHIHIIKESCTLSKTPWGSVNNMEEFIVIDYFCSNQEPEDVPPKKAVLPDGAKAEPPSQTEDLHVTEETPLLHGDAPGLQASPNKERPKKLSTMDRFCRCFQC